MQEVSIYRISGPLLDQMFACCSVTEHLQLFYLSLQPLIQQVPHPKYILPQQKCVRRHSVLVPSTSRAQKLLEFTDLTVVYCMYAIFRGISPGCHSYIYYYIQNLLEVALSTQYSQQYASYDPVLQHTIHTNIQLMITSSVYIQEYAAQHTIYTFVLFNTNKEKKNHLFMFSRTSVNMKNHKRINDKKND